MNDDDEELGLAPRDDEEELSLVPVDDAAERTIAPELPFTPGMRLIPVNCSACKTRLYAGEEQVGLWKKCPVCDRLNEIHPVPPKFVLVANDPEAAGGYGIGKPEASRKEYFRKLAENRQKTEEFNEALTREKKLNASASPLPSAEQTPLMERMLNSLLKSDEEKTEEETVLLRQQEIENRVEAVKKAAREGKLEEYLALSENDDPDAADPVARKLAERERQFEAASVPISPPVLAETASVSAPPVLAPSEFAEPEDDDFDEEDFQEESSDRFLDSSLWRPLLDKRCRMRMLILLFAGLVGNLFGEKARSMLWQITFDKVYGQSPGYSYNLAESGIFVFSFWLGVVLTIVWIAFLFLFGISLFQETARGKDRVENWIPFDLDFGLSYFGWTLLIFYLSGFPGFILWQGLGFFLPGNWIWVHFVGQFFCFPVLFLSMIEADMFFGGWPKKVPASLWNRKLLWLRFFGAMAILTGIPAAIIGGLIFAGSAYYEHWIMHTPLYYTVATVLLTFCGFFVLFVFRILGKMARQLGIRVK